MHIKQLEIKSFGNRSGLMLDDFSDGVNVIYGPNEAGKTTIMEAVRAALLGFLDGRVSTRNRYELPDGQDRHIYLKLLTQNLQTWHLNRTEGKKGLQIIDENNNSIPESLLAEALHHADRDMYENVFAFSLKELSTLSSLDAAAIQDRLLGTALGAGAISPAVALKVIEDRRNKIFKPRGQKCTVAVLRKKIQEAASQISKLRTLPNDYDVQIRELSESRELRKKIKDDKSETDSTILTVRRLLGTREEWEALKIAETESSRLSHAAKIPPDALTNSDNLSQEIKRTSTKLKEQENLLSNILTQKSGLSPRVELDPYLPELETFISEGTSQQAFPMGLQNHQDAFDKAKQDAEKKRQACGEQWTEVQTQKISPDRVLKQAVLSKIETLKEVERKHSNIGTRLDDTSSSRRDVQFKLEELKNKRKSLDSLAKVPLDAVNLVAGHEIQIEEIRKEEHRNHYESKQKLEVANGIEINKDLAKMRPIFQKFRAELSATSGLSERITVNKGIRHDLEEKLVGTLLKCGKNVTENIVRKTGNNDFLADQLADWQDKWSELRISLTTSSAHIADLKKRRQSEKLALAKDLENSSFTSDQPKSPDHYNKIIQEQKSSCRQFEKLSHILADQQKTAHKLKQEHLKIEVELEARIRELGADWEKDYIREHAVTQVVLKSAQQWSTKIETDENLLNQISEDVEEIRVSYREAQIKYEKAQSASKAEVNALDTSSFDLIAPLGKWLSIYQDINECNAQIKKLRNHQQESANNSNQFDKQPSTIKTIMIIAGLATVTATGLLFFVGDLLYPSITVALAGFSVVGILWFIRRGIIHSVEAEEKNTFEKQAKIKLEIDEIQGRCNKFKRRIKEISKSLPENCRTPEKIEKTLENLQSSMSTFLVQRQDLDNVKRLQDQVIILKGNLDQREAREKNKIRQLASTRKEWETWRTSLQGPFTGTSEEVISTMNQLRDLQAFIRQEDTLLEDTKHVNESILKKQTSILEIVKTHELASNYSEDDYTVGLSALEARISQLEEFRATAIRVKSLETEIVEMENKFQEEETKFNQLKEEWQLWLKDENLPALDNPANGRSLLVNLRGALDILLKRDQLAKDIEKEEKRFIKLKAAISDSLEIVTTNIQSMSQLIPLVEERYQQCIMAEDNKRKQKELQKNAVEAEKRADNALQRIKEKENDLQQMVQQFGFQTVADFHASKEMLAQYETLRHEINRLTPELDIINKHIVTIEKEYSEAAEICKNTSHSLKEVLARHHLPVDIEPTVLSDFVDALIEHAKSINTLSECQELNTKIRKRWNKMTSRYSPLLQVFSYSSDFESMEPEMIIGNIRAAVQKLKDEDTKRKKHAELTRSEHIAAEIMTQIKTEYEERVTALNKILQNAEAPDIESFREWARDSERLRLLQQTINEKEAILLTTMDITDRSHLHSYFETIDWENNQVKLDSLLEEQKHFEEELSRLDKQIGASEQIKTDYEKKAELAEFRQVEASGIGQLEAAFMEWMEWEVAAHLIAMARDRFEKERQPKVLKEASEYFRILTGEAWQGIRIRLGEKEMEAEQNNGKLVPIINLSSGTAEPLYLAIRLALITDFARSSLGAPPVLMDDILVNLDDNRAANAAAAIMKVGKGAQIILLTCHERTVKQFQDAGESVKIHNISLNEALPV